MKVTFEFVKAILEPFITIHAQEKTPEVIDLGNAIQDLTQEMVIVGMENGRSVRVSLFQVQRFHTQGKQVVCETDAGSYLIHQRIYQLAEKLPEQLFIQISSAEIVRIGSIRQFSLTGTGLIQVDLADGSRTFASRRYTQQLKRRLLK